MRALVSTINFYFFLPKEYYTLFDSLIWQRLYDSVYANIFAPCIVCIVRYDCSARVDQFYNVALQIQDKIVCYKQRATVDGIIECKQFATFGVDEVKHPCSRACADGFTDNPTVLGQVAVRYSKETPPQL